jgi:hypothetical protein
MVVPIISIFINKNREHLNKFEWVNQTIKLTYEFVNQNLQRTAMRQKKNYDRGVNPRTFEAGAFVWRWYPSKAQTHFAIFHGHFLQDRVLNDLHVLQGFLDLGFSELDTIHL